MLGFVTCEALALECMDEFSSIEAPCQARILDWIASDWRKTLAQEKACDLTETTKAGFARRGCCYWRWEASRAAHVK
jgi:hypothetical protein